MLATIDALLKGYEVKTFDGIPAFVYTFGDNNEYELFFEPLLFGQMYIALYKNGDLLTEKVAVKPIDKKGDI